MRAWGASVIVWITGVLSWIAHATDCSNFSLSAVLAKDPKKEFFVSGGEGLVCRDMTFLMVVVVASK